MAPASKSVDFPNQVRPSFVEQGDPSGVPVLLLPGLGDSWRSFERVLAHLHESVRAFALTQRGHADSSHPRMSTAAMISRRIYRVHGRSQS